MKKCQKLKVKVSGGCAQKVGVMEGDKVSSLLSSLCVKLQFQIIIQYSREHKGWIWDGELKKNTLDKRNSFEEEDNIVGVTTDME